MYVVLLLREPGIILPAVDQRRARIVRQPGQDAGRVIRAALPRTFHFAREAEGVGECGKNVKKSQRAGALWLVKWRHVSCRPLLCL